MLRRALIRRPTRAQRGSVAVEFALIVPLLLLLTLGLIQYGLYFYARQGGSDISRDAARRSAVFDSTMRTCADFKTQIRNRISSLAGSASATSATISRTYTSAPGSPDPTTVQPGDTVTVSVAFKSYDMHVPLVPFIRNGTVSTTTDARVEYVPTVTPVGSCS